MTHLVLYQGQRVPVWAAGVTPEAPRSHWVIRTPGGKHAYLAPYRGEVTADEAQQMVDDWNSNRNKHANP